MTGMRNTICERPRVTSEMQSITIVKNNLNRHGVHYVKHETQLREQMTTNANLTMPAQMPSHTCDVQKMLYKMQKSKREWLHVIYDRHKLINNQ